MTIKQLLLVLHTYPDAPPVQTVESAVFLARHLGARVTALVPQLSDDPDLWPPSLGTWPVDFVGLVADAVRQSGRNAQRLTDALTIVAGKSDVSMDIRRNLAPFFSGPKLAIDLARLHDVVVMRAPEADGSNRQFVESMIFDTGRPTVLLPTRGEPKALQRLGTVLVAWDYGREAARALGDAMPILARAKKVHILSISGEKGLDTSCTPSDLQTYLAAHQVNYFLEQRARTEGVISDLIAGTAMELGADMIVMGAYSHTRIRERILGGATSDILANPPLPVFLSH
ncbi:MAG: universal stress protein [Rhizomicrobium sp.]